MSGDLIKFGSIIHTVPILDHNGRVSLNHLDRIPVRSSSAIVHYPVLEDYGFLIWDTRNTTAPNPVSYVCCISGPVKGQPYVHLELMHLIGYLSHSSIRGTVTDKSFTNTIQHSMLLTVWDMYRHEQNMSPKITREERFFEVFGRTDNRFKDYINK